MDSSRATQDDVARRAGVSSLGAIANRSRVGGKSMRRGRGGIKRNNHHSTGMQISPVSTSGQGFRFGLGRPRSSGAGAGSSSPGLKPSSPGTRLRTSKSAGWTAPLWESSASGNAAPTPQAHPACSPIPSSRSSFTITTAARSVSAQCSYGLCPIRRSSFLSSD